MLTTSASKPRRILILYINIPDEKTALIDELNRIKPNVLRSAEGSENQIDWTIDTFNPLKTGGVLCPADWFLLSRTIFTAVESLDIDSVMVLHHFDSLAYSAAAMSFHLLGLPATVVFFSFNNAFVSSGDDYLKTMTDALVATQPPRPCGVYVFSVDEFIPAVRCSPMGYSDHRRLFVRRSNELTAKAPLFTGRFDYPRDSRPTSVAVLPIFPGYSEKQIECLLNSGVKALVLEFSSVRIIDFRTDELCRVLRSAYLSHVVVVAITQFYERGLYDADNCFMNVGVVSGGDMTREAAYGKLHVLMATELTFEKIRHLAGENLLGEMT